MKLKTFWLVLLSLVAIRLVLMVFAPVFEPSEARYAAISANMARSGDFVVPRFTHDLEYQSFDGKPPLVFQAGGLCVKALGTDAPWKLQFAVRVFPFLSAALVMLILYFSVARLSDKPTGRLAVAMCATSTAFYAAAGISMTDMTLTCCVAGALLLYRTFIDTRGFASAAGVAALLGAGMITKGPVALVMFGLPVLLDAIVHRRWSAMFSWKWIVVAPVFFAVAVPWFVLVEQRNPGSVWYFFYNENFMRFISHDYGDKYGAGREAFRGVSILWALVAVMPWTFVPFGRVIYSAWQNRSLSWRKRLAIISETDNLSGFFFLSCLAIVGFWCLTSRVLLYYLFPVIPVAAAWYALHGPREILRRLVVPYAALSACIVVFGLAGGAMFSEKMQGASTPFRLFDKNYAYEFYNGRLSDEELAQQRARHDEILRKEAEWRRAHKKDSKGKKGK